MVDEQAAEESHAAKGLCKVLDESHAAERLHTKLLNEERVDALFVDSFGSSPLALRCDGVRGCGDGTQGCACAGVLRVACGRACTLDC